MKTLLFVSVLLLQGCFATLPQGVEMSDDERAACKAETCTVWTPAELQEAARRVFLQGYLAGKNAM